VHDIQSESSRFATAPEGRISKPVETCRRAILEAAIDRLTRALVNAEDAEIPALVVERAAMRAELCELVVEGTGNVIKLDPFRRSP
jgi:hypothetical protein